MVLAGAVALAACQVSDEPNLSQTQQALVSVSPSSLIFTPSVQVGQQSAAATIAVNPGIGENYDVITAVTENCPDFTVSAPGLPAPVYRYCLEQPNCPKYQICPLEVQPICETSDYLSYAFTARFAPVVAGTVSCTVTISLQNGTSKTMSLTGTGTLPPKDIDVTPTQVAFGDVRNGTASSPVNMSVRNVGGVAMTVTSVTISSGFTIVSGPTGQYGLNPSQTQPYTITCNPTAVGNMSGNFTVKSDDPATPTVNIPLTCRGIDSAVALTPSPTTLATTRVGEPVQTNVTIANSGAASMTLEGVSVTGGDLELMSAPSNGTYASGTVGTAVVRFGASDKGEQSGMLTVTYDGGKTRTSTITARALATSMALSPDGDVDFGPVCAGQSKTQTFSILANDEGSFQVTEVAGLTAPFVLDAPNLPVNVAGNGATTVSFDVIAEPTEAGPQTSELHLTTNIPGAAPRTINLMVEALPAGVTPSPAALEFGSTQPMTTTLGQMIHLSNCAETEATYSNARIEGENAGEFAIVVPPAETSIPANGKVSWVVVLSAQTPGLKHAEFVVDLADGTSARIPLDGEGLGAGVDGGALDGEAPEISYYTCSTSGSSAAHLAPLLLAIGIVVRRRRRRS